MAEAIIVKTVSEQQVQVYGHRSIEAMRQRIGIELNCIRRDKGRDIRPPIRSTKVHFLVLSLD